ncbi:MAG TPA: sigma 54-interacting transcriptional regulator [Myxococcaceae bacterium]|nr:sigma 54-interacting transcriptional regulator [Myxococcaceae bacterium]
MTQDATLSLAQPTAKEEIRPAPHLFLEIECDRPLAGPARFRLTGLDHVRLGRGQARRSYNPPRALAIEVPDGWMSVEHVELRRIDGKWIAVDRGSKNGMILDGRAVEEAELSDGDLLQLGHTFFRFRTDIPATGDPAVDFVSQSAAIGPLSTLSMLFQGVVERATAAAQSRVPVLLSGESGTGKEVLARYIHTQSGRRGSLVAVNSGAIPSNLVESELFGYKKGAFSGAAQDRAGWVRASDGGTLFLDEIGDLPLTAQSAFLRVLQESEVMPVGGQRPEPIDLRVLAATHHDLKRLVREDRFRHDLLARLEGLTLKLPPLRDRAEDIPLLMVVLLRKLAPERPDVKFTPAAAQAILDHDWPLNIRELEQALAGALALSGTGSVPIDVDHLPETILKLAGPKPARELTPDEARHRDQLLDLFREHGGNLSAVARSIQKGRTQVMRWVARYGIDVNSLRR